MKPQRSSCVCQESNSPSIHAAICSVTSWMGHPTSCSTAQPAPRHLQKFAIPEGFLNSKAEFQLRIKGEASVFKQSAPEVAGSGSRETKRPSLCLHPPRPPVLGGSQPTQGLSWALGSHPCPPCNPWDLQALGPSPGIPPPGWTTLQRWDSPRGNSHPPCRGFFVPRGAQQML